MEPIHGCTALMLVSAAAAVLISLRRRRRLRYTKRSGVLFTGTGCSSGLPLMKCRSGGVDGCKSCTPAFRNGWRDPNDRGNVGMLIRWRDDTSNGGGGGVWRDAQIDCGKTFRNSVLRWYAAHEVESLDAVLLTHSHADAILGLDDLRGLQPYDSKLGVHKSDAIHCLCDPRTLRTLRRVFPYLFPATTTTTTLDARVVGAFKDAGLCRCGAAFPGDAPCACSSPSAAAFVSADGAPLEKVRRFVAKVAWSTFPEDASEFEIARGLAGHALPVKHGEDYTAFGFGFGRAGARVVYLSDYTRILPATEALLAAWACEERGIALMVLDALHPSDPCPVHASLEQSVELARRFRPNKTLLVGMSHSIEHHETNRRLKRLQITDKLDVQLAHDGLFVDLAL